MLDIKNSVWVYKTSPASLGKDIARVLNVAGMGILDPHRPTLVKINGNFDKVYPGSNTSPWFLDGLLKGLHQNEFKQITVIEGDLPEFRASQMICRTGFLDILCQNGINFVDYEALPRDKHELPTILQGAQLINVPVFHSHGHAVISCATKNLFGLLPKDRCKYHQVLSEKLIELAQWTSPMFTIVDGTVGLDGESTRRGNPRRLDLILAGWNPLTVDFVAATIMGYDRDMIPLLALATANGMLSDTGHVIGDFTWDSLPHHDFRFEQTMIRRAATTMAFSSLSHFPLFFWFMDRFRRLYHNYNYWKKREMLFTGPWMEYDSIWKQSKLSSYVVD